MIAIAEYAADTGIQEVRFSTDLVRLAIANPTQVAMPFREGGDGADNNKRSLSVLNNHPQGKSIKPISDEPPGVSCSQLETVPSEYCSPTSRKLTDDEKASKAKVRPAAHRAGQASFFGNI